MIKAKRFLQLVALILLAAGAQPAMSAVWQWSTTAASNAGADPTINWAEGMSPSSVNDSARAMMAAVANYRRDTDGFIGATGSSAAYVIASNSGYDTLAHLNGSAITFISPATNGIGVTINLDGLGARPVQLPDNSAVPAGTMVSGGLYTVTYYTATNAFRLHSLFGNPYNVPLGSITWSTLATPPNANFVLAAGQCLSTTTYATYWVALGSPASGSCPGGQFQIIDLSGRVVAGLDNLSGSPAGRLTSSANGCGTAFTTMGVVCANGLESLTTTLAQLPGGITSTNAAQAISVKTTDLLIPFNANVISATISGGPTFLPAISVSGIGQQTSNGSNSISVTSSNTGGTSHPTVQPTMGLYPLLRVL